MEKLREIYKRLRSITIFRPGLRKWIIIALSAVLLLLVVPVIFLLAVNFGMFGKIPDSESLENISNNVATEVFSADSVLLGRYYFQNRTNTRFDNISPYLIDALIATEDARFYTHEGVDLRSWMRVFVKSILMGNRDAGGGSTVSQQLAKNLFGRSNEPIILTKAKEAIIARRLEDIYSKQEILTLYFNTVPFGDDIYGVETAAKRYFNKSAKNVSLQEAATLIGMLKANYEYNPRINPEKSRLRRNVVLSQMHKYGYISENMADSVQQLPIKTDLQIITTNTGLATYFREYLRQELEDWAEKNYKDDGSPYNIYADGLKVYTTIDSKIQSYAERAVSERMKELQQVFNDHWKSTKPWNREDDILATAVKRSSLYQKLQKEGASDEEIKDQFAREKQMEIFTHEGKKQVKMSTLDSIKHHLMILHAGVLAMDPGSGHVKAWVGGIDHSFFKYDHVNINTKRQVGSTIKPIVYTAALQSGIDPCRYISSAQVAYVDNDQQWIPRNSNNEYELKYSMTGALMNSVNTVSVKLLNEAGIDHTIKLAKAMGIQSHIPEVRSIALGTNTASLFEMVQAYCTYANNGKPVTPVYISAIANQNGEIIEHFDTQIERSQIISSEYNMMMIEMMKSVVDHGTASRLRWKYKINNEVAGKTGTTQNNADGWFIGITPKLVVGTWVGADDPRIRFRYTSLGQGSNTALPIFAELLKQLNGDEDYKNITEAKFPEPDREVLNRLNCAPSIEEKPNLWEILFGEKEEKEEEKKKEEDSDSFFKNIGDLFKRKKDN